MMFFKPDDFSGEAGGYTQAVAEDVAKIANYKLERAMGPKVYGTICHAVETTGVFTTVYDPRDTHEAVLLNIRELHRCPHDRVVSAGTITEGNPTKTSDSSWRCLDCGRKVEPTSWKILE